MSYRNDSSSNFAVGVAVVILIFFVIIFIGFAFGTGFKAAGG